MILEMGKMMMNLWMFVICVFPICVFFPYPDKKIQDDISHLYGGDEGVDWSKWLSPPLCEAAKRHPVMITWPCQKVEVPLPGSLF